VTNNPEGAQVGDSLLEQPMVGQGALQDAVATIPRGTRLLSRVFPKKTPKMIKNIHFQPKNGQNRPPNAVLRHFSANFASKTSKSAFATLSRRMG
jgi:hypothetical protein